MYPVKWECVVSKENVDPLEKMDFVGKTELPENQEHQERWGHEVPIKFKVPQES